MSIRVQTPEKRQALLGTHGQAENLSVSSVVDEVPRSPGDQLDAGTPAFIEPCLSHDFSKVKVYGETRLDSWLPVSVRSLGLPLAQAPVVFPSTLAEERGSDAVMLDGTVHLARGISDLSGTQLEMALAHESVHLAQQRGGSEAGTVRHLELEAQQLAPEVLAGRPFAPRFHAAPGVALNQPKQPEKEPTAEELRQLYEADEFLLQDARDRLEILRRYQAIAKRRLTKERDKLDKNFTDLAKVLGGDETAKVSRLNRRALSVDVSNDEVLFFIQIQARFEGIPDKDAQAQFPTLRNSLEKGLRTVWDQQLANMPLAGKKFEVFPTITLISAKAPRDLNYWLVTVRPNDTDAVVYAGQKLADQPGGKPTSYTDSDLDGGVMSVPPSHIGKPSVLGHESLHFFGLVDRYMIVQLKGKEQTLEPIRPGDIGQRDPLAAKPGTILLPDLDFLFEGLGVYDKAVEQGLSEDLYVAKQASKMKHISTDNLSQIDDQIMRLELRIKAITDSRKPASPAAPAQGTPTTPQPKPNPRVPIRKAFIERILQEVENLP